MFRTELSNTHPKFNFTHQDKILSLGSCFAQNIGTRLSTFKFEVCTNPSGILFNPLSIFELLAFATGTKTLPPTSYQQLGSTFLNYKFHSQLNANSEKNLKQKVNNELTHLKECLENTAILMLTFGTAWVYRTKNTEMLVANCHKVPQNQFNKELSGVEEIIDEFGKLKNWLDQVNPNLKILLTVSPVRHVKEGLANNNLSKSILRLACHKLTEAFDLVDYFPAYEILMDDLRDYRFYAKDMIHPNEQAQDYVWEKFSSTYFSEPTIAFKLEWQDMLNALNHKPFHPTSEEHQSFLRHTLLKLENLSATVDVSNEIEAIKSQITAH